MPNHAVKQALLTALAGRPVSSIVQRKAKPHKPAKLTPVKSQREEVRDAARMAKFCEGIKHEVHGLKHQSQVVTLQNRVLPYIEPTMSTMKRRSEKAKMAKKPRCIPCA